MVGISAVKDLLIAGGTFSEGNVQRLQARNGDKHSVESSPISTPAKIPVEPILVNVSTW
jgi:hypothetical protein